MELLLDKEPVYLTETVYDGQIEQGVELDHVLPDYYPDIFKILKCSLTPCIVSYSVSGTQLFIDGVVYIKVLYLSDNGTEINCIDSRYTYSKTIELARAVESPKVWLFPRVDYCNCRAVSGRRIDVRGAVSCKIRVTGCYRSELLRGVSGMGTQVRNCNVSCCENRLYADRQYVVREDIETGAGGGIVSVLSVSCTVSDTDTKVITDKVVVKGEAKVRALYVIRTGDGKTGTEVMEASVPLSQIIDIEGITDAHSCFARMSIMDCDLEIKQGDDGENRTFGCDITVDCRVSAQQEGTVSPVCDLYSSDYESSFSVVPIRIENTPQLLNDQINIRTELKIADGNISEVFDSRCDVINLSSRVNDDGKLVIDGQICVSVIGRNSSGVPVFSERIDSFESVPDIPPAGEGCLFSPYAEVMNVSYSITGDDSVEIRSQLCAGGVLSRVTAVNAVSEITVNEDKPMAKDREYALKLYFADNGESVWDIAKRYNTSVTAVMSENELEQDTVTVAGMLLIPMI